jgi:hypothetical protein
MSWDAATWYQMKHWAAQSSGWSMDTLHVLISVPLHLLFAWLLRTGLADVRPWALLLVVEAANEAYDLWFERWPSLRDQLGAGASDLLATMILPTLLLLVARRQPRLLSKRR